ncbi:Tyrosine-protein phosphatase Lar [Trachymyrmex cornetzi]|uniref:Tyrosine-protein phosphatase Lar n=1 Tax=Trachymyrmex cornetzi TaxID=471704 RepID=A0A195EJF6_9HYME|nr:Tyrosine-protein phosphatase Lar [Trachymyrmex cornetzi]
MFFLFTGPPTILVKPQSQQVKAGGIASFYCTAEGAPPPQIHWRKNGKKISHVAMKKDENFIEIKKMHRSFFRSILSILSFYARSNSHSIFLGPRNWIREDIYTPLLLDSATAQFSILYRPLPPPIIFARPFVTGVFLFTAQTSASIFRLMSTESQSRYVVHQYENGALLRIEPVKPSRDNTNYECLAENGVGDAVSAEATLTGYENLSESNVAFDNSCLVLSSRREDDNDRKGFQGEHENGKDEKRWEKRKLLFASPSSIQGVQVQVLNGPTF